MLTSDDKNALKDLKRTEYYRPLLKLMAEVESVLQRDLLQCSLETEEQSFNLIKQKSRLDGAIKALSLIRAQIEPSKK